MNDRKLKQLFALGRAEKSPLPPGGFDARVAAALRRELRAGPVSLWDQLEELFPRLAVAVILIVSLGLLADLCHEQAVSSLSSGMSQISDQWLFAANGD